MKQRHLKHSIITITSLTLLAFTANNVQAHETVTTITTNEMPLVTEATPTSTTTPIVENTEVVNATPVTEPTDLETKIPEETVTETAVESTTDIEAVDPYELEDNGQLQIDEATPTEGRWVSGEMHAHTLQSADASESYMELDNVLDAAFREDEEDIPVEGHPIPEYGDAFDYQMTADHLRDSPRNVDGEEDLTPTWQVIDEQVDAFNTLKEEGKYEGKIYYPGFEWDMFGLDHSSVAIIEEGTNRVPIDAIREFEWKYAYDTSTVVFDGNEEAVFGPRDNVKGDKSNTFDGLAWLEENYPSSILLVNHPSRHNGDDSGVVKVEDLRQIQDTAPSVVLGFEGMPGNQMGGDRGEMTDIYGGADQMIAQVGGVWDSLLGEGREFYNYANSDFHFKVSSNRLYSSGYWPSEYSRNHTWVEGNTFEDIAEGLKSGNSFSTYGDLITALEFNISQDDEQTVMGGTLNAEEGSPALMTIRFKESENNNYQPISTPHQSDVTNSAHVDHIDVIMGQILGEVADPTIDFNPTTEVVARFTEADWGELDADGFYTIEMPFLVDQDMYFRLRGTNLALNTPGEVDENGNPLLDIELIKPDPEEFETEETYMQALEDFFNAVNDRNYRDLWFYSNPIFVYVNEKSETDIPGAVDDNDEQVEDQEDSHTVVTPENGDNSNETTGQNTVDDNHEVVNVDTIDTTIDDTDHNVEITDETLKNIEVDQASVGTLPEAGVAPATFSSLFGLALAAIGSVLIFWKKEK